MDSCTCHNNPPCPFCVSFASTDCPPEENQAVEVIVDEDLKTPLLVTYRDGKYFEGDIVVRDVLGWREPD